MEWLIVLVSVLLGVFAGWLFMVRSARRVATLGDEADLGDTPATADLRGVAPGAAASAATGTNEIDAGTGGATLTALLDRADETWADEIWADEVPQQRDRRTQTTASASDGDPHSAMQGLAAAADSGEAKPGEADSPYGPGSALPKPDGSAPSAEYRIKANSDTMLYHTAESPSFEAATADVWFRSEEDARRAGFAPYSSSHRVR